MKNLLENAQKIDVTPLVWMTKSTAAKMEQLLDKRYEQHIRKAPVLFNSNHNELWQKINKATCRGNGQKVLDSLLSGKIAQSKKLADSVASMLKGNAEFTLQEQQKVIYETIVASAKTKKAKKQVFIVKGGPGTGKSVLALNLLSTMAKINRSSFYVAPNSSFRAVIKSKVSRKDHGEVADVITGSAVYDKVKNNALDLLIIDEAHRLKDHRARGYGGKNQIADIIRAAKISVFFTDEKQTIRPEDIGYEQRITDAAKSAKAQLHAGEDLELKSQMRTPGASEYLVWLDHALQLEKKEQTDYKLQTEFRIVDDPRELVAHMEHEVNAGRTGRILAGKAWVWSNKINPETTPLVNDVVIEEHGFAMPWSTPKKPELWAISDWGQYQVGSVHSAQGMEFDYAYVIIGKDLTFKNGKVRADPAHCRDPIAKRNHNKDPELFEKLIKQTYRILMTRGVLGTLVYIRDNELKEHFKKALSRATTVTKQC